VWKQKEKAADNSEHTNDENIKRNKEPDIPGVEKNGAQENKNIQDDSTPASQEKIKKTRVEINPIEEDSSVLDSEIEIEVVDRLDEDVYPQPHSAQGSIRTIYDSTLPGSKHVSHSSVAGEGEIAQDLRYLRSNSN